MAKNSAPPALEDRQHHVTIDTVGRVPIGQAEGIRGHCSKQWAKCVYQESYETTRLTFVRILYLDSGGVRLQPLGSKRARLGNYLYYIREGASPTPPCEVGLERPTIID